MSNSKIIRIFKAERKDTHSQTTVPKTSPSIDNKINYIFLKLN